jgi:hypothetical protein
MLSSRPAAIVFSLWSACSLGAVAQQPSAQTIQAGSVLQASLKSLTGGASISDVTISATAHRIVGADDQTGTATLTAMAAGESKLRLSLLSGVFVETRTPVGNPPAGSPAGAVVPAGGWSGPDGVTHGMVAHNLMTDATWFLPAFTINKLAGSTGFVASYIGQETREGQQVLHLSASQQYWPSSGGQALIQVPPLIQQMSQMDLYLDPTTLLPVALAFYVHPDNNFNADIPSEVRYSDYRSVNGVQVPFHVQRYLNNSLILDLNFETVAFNSGLNVTSFAIE